MKTIQITKSKQWAENQMREVSKLNSEFFTAYDEKQALIKRCHEKGIFWSNDYNQIKALENKENQAFKKFNEKLHFLNGFSEISAALSS